MTFPICPACGSRNIKEWGTIEASYDYDVTGYLGQNTHWDSYTENYFQCNVCGYEWESE